MVRTFDTRAEADAACAATQSVSATYAKDGKTPVYFLVDAETGPDEMRRLAFQVKYGRPLSGYEQTMLGLAEAGFK